MKKLIFISLLCFSLPVLYAQNAVDLTRKESIENWINTHRFKASVEGDFDMYLEIEHLSIGDALVLSNDHGKRKIFGQLSYQLNQTAPSVVGVGLEESSLEVFISPEGNLLTSGMTFVPEKE
ncbi:MAG: hypothetical protein RL365_777 [Bacteroidota bacterium]|jgi:hypothetical protein